MKKKVIDDVKVLGMVLAPVLAFMLAMGVTSYPVQKDAANKGYTRQQQRAKQFAEYIVGEVSDIAKNSAVTDWAIAYYKRDPEKAEQYIKKLEADSTKYANAIFRDAPVALNEVGDRVDNVLTFQEAANRMARKPFRPGSDKRIGSLAHNLNVNREHLKNISVSLAEMRKAKSIVTR